MIEEYLVYNVGVIVFIFLSAFFSGTETSIVSANRFNIEVLARKGKKSAERSIYVLDNLEDAVGMVLIGNNVANISATAFIIFIATNAFALEDTELLAVTVIQTLLFLVACEITPKVVAKAKADQYLMFFSVPIKLLMIVLKPAVRFSLLITVAYKKIFRLEKINNSIVPSRDEIDLLYEIGEKEGLINEENKNYVSEILSFRETAAYDIMRPLVDIVSIEKSDSVRNLVALIDKTGFSRMPVYESRVDNIIGYIFYRDILKNRNAEKVYELIIKAHYIPGTKNIYELYLEMQQNKMPLVFVVNEHGGVTGMVTHEDIAEELVGEIQTEDHEVEDFITEISARKYRLRGDLDIDYFRRYFSIDIDKKGFETIAGFLMFYMKKIPRQGDSFEYKKIKFLVEEATERSVEKVVITVDKTRKIKKVQQ